MKNTNRYYYYISDSKVDMLLPQLSSAERHEVAAEIGVDVGILSMKMGTKRLALDNRVDRVRAVEYQLSRRASLSNETSDPWFFGTLVGRCVQLSQAEEAAFFWGRFNEQNILLAGSSKHLVGGEPSERISVPISYLPRLMHTLEKLAELEVPAGRNIGFGSEPVSETEVAGDARERMWSTIFELIAQGSQEMPEEQLEFVARRLMATESGGAVAVLATPLFVVVEN